MKKARPFIVLALFLGLFSMSSFGDGRQTNT